MERQAAVRIPGSPGPPGTSAPWGPAASPAAPTEEPTPDAGPPPAERSAAELLAEVATRSAQSSETAESWIADEWKGKPIAGTGKVTIASKIYGTDSDFAVSTGHKVTVEVPAGGSGEQLGVSSPRISIHLPEAPPEELCRYGAQVRFRGVVRQYRGLMRTLLLESGELEEPG